MRKVILYIATSLNGKIAKPDWNVGWLESIPNPDNSDYGYSEFYKTIDTTIQGNNTYKLILGWEISFPYSDKKNYVFTTQKDLQHNEDVEYISKDHVQFVKKLKSQEGKDIWLIGGGKLNTLFLENKLIDEIHLHIMPIMLSDGVDVINVLPKDVPLLLLNSKTYSTGVVELKYKSLN